MVESAVYTWSYLNNPTPDLNLLKTYVRNTMRRILVPLMALLLIAGCSEKEKSSSEDYSDQSANVTSATPAPMDNPDAPDSITDENLTRPDADDPVNGPGEFPLGWIVRLDRPNPDVIIGRDKTTADVSFVNMTPGWHFATKTPRIILYHPASTASGSYTVTSKIHLFDPGTRTEAYGLIFGGSDLDGDAQQYLYFVIRRSGEYLVKQRQGDDTVVIKDWTAHKAIVGYDENSGPTATNTLAVSVTGNTIAFSVNNMEVYSMPRGDYQTDGLVGFRFNHGIETHIESFDVTIAS